MKTKEELNALKEEVKAMSNKLAELNEDELEQVTGGVNNFNKSFTKSITLISAGICGKSVNVNEVLTVTPSSKTLATRFENSDMIS